jgi:hypothetical protein
MNTESAYLFNVVRYALLIGPLAGLVIGWALPSRRRRQAISISALALAPLILFGSLELAGITFHGTRLDALVFAMGYAGYCLAATLMVRGRLLPDRVARWWPVLLLPVAVGYLAATVGVLGLGWQLDDYIPGRIDELGPTLRAEVRAQNLAISWRDNGVRVAVYRTFWDGWMERRVAQAVIVPSVPLREIQVRRQHGAVGDSILVYVGDSLFLRRQLAL